MAKARKLDPVPHEGEQQGGGGQGVGRVGEGKAQHHGGVEDEIQRDVEKPAAVGDARFPRHGAIQPVQQPVEQNRRQRPLIAAKGQQRQRQHADEKAGEAHLVGAHPGPAQGRRARRGRRITGSGGDQTRWCSSSGMAGDQLQDGARRILFVVGHQQGGDGLRAQALEHQVLNAARSGLSRREKGSSSSNALGSASRARSRLTRAFWPPESAPGSLSA